METCVSEKRERERERERYEKRKLKVKERQEEGDLRKETTQEKQDEM